jgi:adenylate cyclase
MSFVTDAEGGFSEEALGRMQSVARQLALGATLAAASRSGAAALDTYIGPLAGARVREGNILRGRAEPVRAVVWSSDLTGFTRITESVETEELLSLLNDYTGELVDAVGAHGGEVLKFIGDGLLAIFPADQGGPAAALSAAREARTRIEALSAARRSAGRVVTDFCLGLHLGEVLFGNFGAASRLDFTVLGPAVNEVSRMLGLCKTLDQRTLASAAFHAELGERSTELVSVGRYALRGVGAPQHLFTLEAG